MMIKTIEVVGLPRQSEPIRASLHGDLNIVTGRNGSGKTTLLKLLWYIISGNIGRALEEVPFQRVMIDTDDFCITVYRVAKNQCRVDFEVNGTKQIFEDGVDEDDNYADAEDLANDAILEYGRSVFFPTFRRIEGGFTVRANSQANTFTSPFSPSLRTAKKSDIEEALVSLSRRLSNQNHTFVASISTVDIVAMLMRKYTDVSELANNLQQKTSMSIIEEIKNYKRSGNSQATELQKATAVLEAIQSMTEQMENSRTELMAPINAIRDLSYQLFKQTGIKLNSSLSFGDAATAISSDLLSAGEKQMFSFICYNAFNQNSIIFIDEPELSLHVDWQRQLFPILQGQSTSNQFIVATHSPFIYSKYPDKEILMSEDRGASAMEID